MKAFRQGLMPFPPRLGGLIGLAIIALAAASGGVAAAEGIDDHDLEQIEGSLTDIDGTRQYNTEEEPRVLHIVPWQSPTVGERHGQMPSVVPRGSTLQPLGVDTLRGYREFRIIGNGTGSSPPG